MTRRPVPRGDGTINDYPMGNLRERREEGRPLVLDHHWIGAEHILVGLLRRHPCFRVRAKVCWRAVVGKSAGSVRLCCG